MSRNINDIITIPKNWSAEQAYAVYQFVEKVLSAIWDTHDLKILEEMRKQDEIEENLNIPHIDEFFEEDLPL